MKAGYVYLLTNGRNGTLYLGVTSDLIQRIVQHRAGVFKKSFSYRYNLKMLVYYEVHDTIEYALAREKQIKNWKRK